VSSLLKKYFGLCENEDILQARLFRALNERAGNSVGGT
jgi:hypothetical protein